MDEIGAYFQSLQLPEPSLRHNIEGFERNPDIAAEFAQWIRTGEYPLHGCLRVEGYSARDIDEMAPILHGAGVYNFLITLREKPVQAKRYIQEGFKMK